jgi:NADPH:quinone reductase-like Zn-dependent oxidoreductase
MKAVVWTNYGPPDVLKVQEIENPVPKANEVLIQIHSTSVTAGDCELRRFKIPTYLWLPIRIYTGLRSPGNIILGQEISGKVIEVGEQVTKFKKGDQIFAATGFRFGGYAEYVCLPENDSIYIKSTKISFEVATTIPTGGINGLHFVQLCNIKPGDKVLINGAGGSIGTYAVQIAKKLGAEVTCVDSADKLKMLQTIGSDYVVDYESEDYTQSKDKYDAIIDVIGSASISKSIKLLNRKGRLILGNPSLKGMLKGLWISITSSKRVKSELAKYKPEDFYYLTEMIEKGHIIPVIDRSFLLEDIVDAHQYVEKGYKKGNIIVKVL